MEDLLDTILFIAVLITILWIIYIFNTNIENILSNFINDYTFKHLYFFSF